MDTQSHQAKYYHNNKEKVLEYKKEYYYNKIKKYEPFKNIFIYNIKKSHSNVIIKRAINHNKLLINIGNNIFNINEFIETHKVFLPTNCLAHFINQDDSEFIPITKDFPHQHWCEYFDKNYKLLINLNSII